MGDGRAVVFGGIIFHPEKAELNEIEFQRQLVTETTATKAGFGALGGAAGAVIVARLRHHGLLPHGEPAPAFRLPNLG